MQASEEVHVMGHEEQVVLCLLAGMLQQNQVVRQKMPPHNHPYLEVDSCRAPL